MKPAKPQHIEQCAAACLETLAGRALGEKISLGGAFGLAYYLEYRTTHDIDAWWSQSASETDRHEVISLLQEVLCGFGSVKIRSWGDVVSIELKSGGKTVFSFQIAARPGQIEESMPAPWPSGLLLDSLRDLIAAKMVALVERGAPRDFRDIYAVCDAGLADAEMCWNLWQLRRTLAGDDTAPGRARTALLTHLERIELHRPLSAISDPQERHRALSLRTWFRGRFLHGLVD